MIRAYQLNQKQLIKLLNYKISTLVEGVSIHNEEVDLPSTIDDVELKVFSRLIKEFIKHGDVRKNVTFKEAKRIIDEEAFSEEDICTLLYAASLSEQDGLSLSKNFNSDLDKFLAKKEELEQLTKEVNRQKNKIINKIDARGMRIPYIANKEKIVDMVECGTMTTDLEFHNGVKFLLENCHRIDYIEDYELLEKILAQPTTLNVFSTFLGIHGYLKECHELILKLIDTK